MCGEYLLSTGEIEMAEKRIEDIINDVLNDDLKETALDFAQYLRDNEMTVGGAEVRYKGNIICYMHLDGSSDEPGPWTIWSDGDYSSEHKDVPIDNNMKEIAWANINICSSCGGKCSPGKRKMIFGKEFDNVCNADMAFYKPNSETLKCVKKLLEMRKRDCLENK